MKKVLFVCKGNTCRSPMAKAILEQMMKERGLEGQIAVDSAAKSATTSSGATHKAREAIKQLYGKDLLLDHKSKSITDVKLSDFSLILVMEECYRNGLPEDRTCTLKEYAGLEGKVSDPFDEDIKVYEECRDEIKNCLERAMNKIINDC